jgi:hypothetical protein
MIDLLWLYGCIVILLLFIICFLLNFWAKEHATLMAIMSHSLAEIKKKIK